MTRLGGRASDEALLVRRGGMAATAFRVRLIYHVLLAAFGPQGWWPGGDPFETVVGAVLTQNTSWRNVERALANLRSAGALADPDAMSGLAPGELEDLVRPAGFYRQKASTLKRLLARTSGEPGGLRGVLSRDGAWLRRWLVETKGIGPETADSIALYASGHPTFVVDAYARRLAERHGLIRSGASYAALKALFEDALPRSARVMNEYHALIVRLGKTRCRPRPDCGRCPLSWDLGGRGPQSPGRP